MYADPEDNNTDGDSLPTDSSANTTAKAGEFPARSNDHLETKGKGTINYHGGQTRVYTPDHSEIFHADRTCPELSRASFVWFLPLSHVVTTDSLPRRPCSRCTQDRETTIRVAIEYDGVDPTEILL